MATHHLNKHVHALRHSAVRAISSSSTRTGTQYFNNNTNGKNVKGTTVTTGSLTTTSLGMSTSAPTHASSTTTTTTTKSAPPMTKTGTLGSLKQTAMSIPLPRSFPSSSSNTSSNANLPPPVPKSRPLPNSYWATPFLLACEYPYSPITPLPKLDALLLANVRVFIDLTEAGELAHPYSLSTIRSRARALGLSSRDVESLEYHRFPIPDRQVPSSPSTLTRVISLLRTCEERGIIAAVHCRGGIGRTGTVVGCWLVESARARDGGEALEIIGREWCTVEKRRRFPCSPETGAQWEFVRRFTKGCFGEMAAVESAASGMGTIVVMDSNWI